jgi:hypothetical protein
MKGFTKNHISSSINALKLTYDNVEFQKIFGRHPQTPIPGEGRGEEGMGGWGVVRSQKKSEKSAPMHAQDVTVIFPL